MFHPSCFQYLWRCWSGGFGWDGHWEAENPPDLVPLWGIVPALAISNWILLGRALTASSASTLSYQLTQSFGISTQFYCSPSPWGSRYMISKSKASKYNFRFSFNTIHLSQDVYGRSNWKVWRSWKLTSVKLNAIAWQTYLKTRPK